MQKTLYMGESFDNQVTLCFRCIRLLKCFLLFLSLTEMF